MPLGLGGEEEQRLAGYLWYSHWLTLVGVAFVCFLGQVQVDALI